MIRSESLDKFAILLSGICLVQCLVFPIAMTAVPILSASFLVDDHLFHELMLWFVLPTSVIALGMGCRKHRDLNILITGVIGLSIVVAVTFWGHDIFGESLEKYVTSIGGIVLAYAHYLNYKSCQEISCNDKNCSTDHHH